MDFNVPVAKDVRRTGPLYALFNIINCFRTCLEARWDLHNRLCEYLVDVLAFTRHALI
jgi:hypothetical protein